MFFFALCLGEIALIVVFRCYDPWFVRVVFVSRSYCTTRLLIQLFLMEIDYLIRTIDVDEKGNCGMRIVFILIMVLT